MPLSKVKRAHILDLEVILSEYLSASTRKTVIQHLCAAFREAMYQDLLVKNPAEGIKVSATRAEKNEVKRRKALTDHELAQFMQAAQGDPLYPLFYVIFTLGLRCSEALGLRWTDVNPQQREIHIRQAQNEQRAHLDHLRPQNDLIFTTGLGTMLDRHTCSATSTEFASERTLRSAAPTRDAIP